MISRPHDLDHPLVALGDEVTLVHYRLNALLEAVHPDEPNRAGGVAGRRGVLRSLLSFGPMTVPAIAALRPASRQHMQRVVDDLLRDGLVERRPNPIHRRSPLIALTEHGRRRLAEHATREAPLLAAARSVLAGGEEVDAALGVLRRLRAHIDSLLAEPEHAPGAASGSGEEDRADGRD